MTTRIPVANANRHYFNCLVLVLVSWYHPIPMLNHQLAHFRGREQQFSISQRGRRFAGNGLASAFYLIRLSFPVAPCWIPSSTRRQK
jgi:hypothetical protein